LKTLIQGLSDLRENIRYNCYMELGSRTGQWFFRDRIRAFHSPVDYCYAAARYRSWLAKRTSPLIWDDKVRCFNETRSSEP